MPRTPETYGHIERGQPLPVDICMAAAQDAINLVADVTYVENELGGEAQSVDEDRFHCAHIPMTEVNIAQLQDTHLALSALIRLAEERLTGVSRLTLNVFGPRGRLASHKDLHPGEVLIVDMLGRGRTTLLNPGNDFTTARVDMREGDTARMFNPEEMRLRAWHKAKNLSWNKPRVSAAFSKRLTIPEPGLQAS